MSDVDEAIAAGRVPAGITAAYLKESKDQPAIAGIIFVTVLTFIVVVGRLLSRAFIVRRFGFDDGLALVSLLCLIAFVGLSIELIKLGSGRHFEYIQYVLDVPTVQRTQVLDFVAHIIYTTALLFCRVSGLAFYYRVCGMHKGFLLAIKVVFGVLIAGYLPQLFLIVFHCRPVTGLWPYGWEPGTEGYVCLQWGLVYSVNSSVSLLCDLLLFGIPLAMLRILEMPKKRKVQLGCILLPGIAVIAISITRLVLVILGQWQTDMSWSYNPMLGVETSEIGATLIALSVPGVKPLFDKYVLRKDGGHSHSGGSKYQMQGSSSKRSRGTALSTLRLRSQHSMLASRENASVGGGGVYGAEVSAGGGGRHGDGASVGSSTEGIYVTVDFDVKEGSRNSGTGRRRDIGQAA
ncbi:proteinrelated to integral membrane protein pth11 [Purpureocillium lilacinum]|uniref:Proteinrelated to integral membrane protein pth11 n=1 Tax=Purpureocillium lilacinum TaxID=33203 RepID=A0A179HQB1_PURLI|nr:proteinrelated to integral membrane protein pth11 [Purpureocillium lilacinum]OAQ92537.1 proteinrelated to integral membrane protein pth11 [Purpureocillium lilacinum]